MTKSQQNISVTLATASQARIDMFARAGFLIDAKPAAIDEATIKASLLSEGATPQDIADALAEMKASRIAAKTNGFVIGADQILVCADKIYDKAPDMIAAKEKLMALQGKSHTLLSAAVIYEDGKPVWRKIGRAQLIMRPISEVEIDHYLAQEGAAILSSVGCYFLEGRGVTLFSRIQGDYFTVLGFPLLDVLGYLRDRSVI
ncbi:MAG: Maf family protein [Pseudomonadota bacterium]